VILQLREAFPNEASHRFVIHDDDAIFSAAVAQAIENLALS
jgi:hypothetical protein